MESISPRQEGFKSHLATDTQRLLYFSAARVLSGIPDCLPSVNPVLMAPSIQGEIFIYQITGDIYTYDQDNRLFISIGDIDQDTTDL